MAKLSDPREVGGTAEHQHRPLSFPGTVGDQRCGVVGSATDAIVEVGDAALTFENSDPFQFPLLRAEVLE
jgi:hypothetical protein